MDKQLDGLQIRPLAEHEWEDAMGLAWKTFLKFEANDYSNEGIQNFRDFITDQTLKRMFLVGEYRVLGAFYRGEMIGIVSLRNKEHISLLFVDEIFHKRGVGRMLLEAMREEELRLGGNRLTVNAAPYAVTFYHRVGFVDTNLQRETDGIIYTPMVWWI